MDASIDRALNYYVSKYGNTLPNNLDKAVDFIYNNVSFTIDDNVNKPYIYNRLNNIFKFQKQLEDLKKIPIIEQRSEEWYKARQGLISASDFGQALNRGEYGNQKDFLIKKITNISKKIIYKAPLLWGVKYEEVATYIYSKRNNLNVFDFGLIKHHNLDYIGASPDGISDLGIMLEIKCPYKRKISGKIIEQYYDQIQGQLEVCNLEECDFLECEFEEYTNEEEFMNDYEDKNIKLLTTNLKEKGIIIGYRENQDDEYQYQYTSLTMNTYEMIKWKDNKLSELDITTDFKVNYWKLRKYNCQRVYRDINFFDKENKNLKFLWDKIIYYRKSENIKEFNKHIANNKKPKGRIFEFKQYLNDVIFNGFAIKNVENDYVDIN